MNNSSDYIPPKKRSLGQNFLKDSSVCHRIVKNLDIQTEDCILEIGPGAGALSHLLAEKPPRQMLLLEKDRFWAFKHGEWAKQYSFPYQPILMDALDFPWERLLGNWKIAGNLPYNVASPLIWDIISQAKDYSLAVFMVQKEVGQRMAAPPGGREYGALSVWVQSFCRVERLFIVPPGAFDPKPKVDSAVMRLTPLKQPLHCPAEKLSQLLKICFQQRRKQLKNILRQYWTPSVELFLQSHNLTGEIRPESLTPVQFQKLTNILL